MEAGSETEGAAATAGGAIAFCWILGAGGEPPDVVDAAATGRVYGSDIANEAPLLGSGGCRMMSSPLLLACNFSLNFRRSGSGNVFPRSQMSTSF